MDENREILSRLRFAGEHGVPLRVSSANGKLFTIQVTGIEKTMIRYRFSNGNEGKIRISNILSCEFTDAEVISRYEERQASRYFHVEKPGERIRHFRQYYMEILEKLQRKFDETSFEYKYHGFKIKIYEAMFQNLVGKTGNLLLQYLMGSQERLTEHALPENLVLLLQQSNLSQKRAVKAALGNRVSVIEGPPGTGKTTTILSIIANMVYQGQKVLVVSKNNSAIDNVAEELDGMNLPEFYIRMGNDQVMKAAGASLKKKLEEYERALSDRTVEITAEEADEIRKVYVSLSDMEDQMNRLVSAANEREELKNQLRHLKKRRQAYRFDEEDRKIKRRVSSADKAKKKLELLTKLSIQIGEGETLGLINKISLLLGYQEFPDTFLKYGIYQILYLEEQYLKLRIEELEEMLSGQNMDELKMQIRELYVERYIPLSRKLLRFSIQKTVKNGDFSTIYRTMAEEEKTLGNEGLMKTLKDPLTRLYPVVLTTVDSVLSNFYTNIKNGRPIDCIIIDEASQCDIMSALPLLYLAKRIVVVGDCKQLEAIKGLTAAEIGTEVEENWDFIEQSFLTTVLKTMNPPSNMLMEHYRCDYNIINYCNKYFYDNQLIIYRDASGHAMGLVNSDKGKYVEQENGSFYNERELETIRQMIGEDSSHRFIITPFKRQAERLCSLYNSSQCGTIHTFQGKGEKEVYFTTVLNDTEEAKRHLEGGHNLFGRELINVAVSRAKDRFIMVTDVEFFKKRDENVASLIEYIETYGEQIPDKTVCLFDYLYRQISVFQPSGKADNVFEAKLQEVLNEYLESNEKLECRMKLPLAAVVTDQKYLEEQEKIRDYITHHAHLDYTIHDTRINKPVLVIELDGKYHKEEEQAQRDELKNAALSHMKIPLWRIRSKEAWTEEQLFERLDRYLK